MVWYIVHTTGSGGFDITSSIQHWLSMFLLLCKISTQSVKNCSSVTRGLWHATGDPVVDSNVIKLWHAANNDTSSTPTRSFGSQDDHSFDSEVLLACLVMTNEVHVLISCNSPHIKVLFYKKRYSEISKRLHIKQLLFYTSRFVCIWSFIVNTVFVGLGCILVLPFVLYVIWTALPQM